MSAILAMIYHSFVDSKIFVNKFISLRGCGANLGYIQELPKKINLLTSDFRDCKIRLF